MRLLSAEVFIPETVNRNAVMFMQGFARQSFLANIQASESHIYQGNAQWLILYGAGGEDRQAPWKAQMDKGGRVIMWDLGYWNRYPVSRRLWRMSIDEWHPHDLLPAVEPNPQRFSASGISLRDDYDPDGHIVLCGLGKKSRKFLGHHRNTWECKALDRIHAAYPRRRVVYRPKPGNLETLADLEVARDDRSIEDVLRGASLAVCRHSNVAVDAAIAGVPCACEEGAGAFLFRGSIAEPGRPNREQRVDFLRRVAYFQWGAWELGDALKFCRKLAGD